MEKTIKNIKPEQTTRNWIQKGWAVASGKAKLSTLKVGEYFMKDNLICFITIKNKDNITYLDLIYREHYTRNIDQTIEKIKLIGIKNGTNN